MLDNMVIYIIIEEAYLFKDDFQQPHDNTNNSLLKKQQTVQTTTQSPHTKIKQIWSVEVRLGTWSIQVI